MQEHFTNWFDQLKRIPWMWNISVIGFSIFTGLILKLIISFFFRKKASKEKSFSFFRSFLQHLGTPLTIILPLIVFDFLLDVIRLPPQTIQQIDKTIEIVITIITAWVLIRIINIVQDYVLYKFDITKSDNLRERKIRTQLQFIKNILVVLIVVLCIAAVLLSFGTMRRIGTGLLTGVGIGGIIIGFAAQRSLANLFAGFQIAFTQPIRIDDAVLVENEFGTIEEINLTYVVVRIWNEKRLVLPINYFIERPFQNWTRQTAQLLVTVFIYSDYSVSVPAIREELSRLLKLTPLWDGRVNGLQVTNTTEHIIELRALMSAANSGNAFDLQCFIRENLLDFIKRNYPESLPKTRIAIVNETSVKQTNS